MADERIIDKIKKLFELAKSPNEAEATAAMAKAHDLLTKHNLSVDALETPDEDGIEVEADAYGKTTPWKSALLMAIAQANYCGAYLSIDRSYSMSGRRSSTKTFMFVGKPVNIIACKAMADYILKAIDRNGKLQYGKGKSFVASYKKGFAAAVRTRLYQLRKEDQADPTCTALVVRSDAEVKAFMDAMKLGKAQPLKANATNYAGYTAGTVDGSRLSLNAQVGAARVNPRLSIAG